MRATGISHVLTWRWAPCVALVLGSFSFVGFVCLAIPERIGDGASSSGTGSRLGLQLSRTQAASGVVQAADFSGDDTSDEQLGSTSAVAKAGGRAASRLASNLPRRGFTPPLDRPAQATPPSEPSPVLQPQPPPATQPPPAAPPPAAEAAAPGQVPAVNEEAGPGH